MYQIFNCLNGCMKHYRLRPDVPGTYRERPYPQFTFDDVPDDLFTSHPEFLATPPLAAALAKGELIGLRLCEVTTSVSELFRDLNDDQPVPALVFVLVINEDSRADVFTDEGRLVVPERVMGILRGFSIERCTVEAMAEH